MNSSVLQCCDYISLPIPVESTRWKISDEEILQELQALSADHAVERQVTRPVQTGDCVRCVCRDAADDAWKGRVVLLYPGRAMPGAEQAEQAVLGHSAGEVFASEISGTTMQLEITDVICHQSLPLGDELVQTLALPGVETVEDYKGWYRQQHDGERRQKACYAIVSYWLKQIADRSEIRVDEAERRDWTLHRARKLFPALLRAGIDARKPRDGGEPLTEEQAIEAIAREQERYFVPFVIYCYFCDRDHFSLTEQDYLAELEQLGAQRGLTLEEAKEQSDFTFYLEQKYQEHTYLLLSREAEAFLEV